MTTLYGITNCDKIRSARAWLESAYIPYNFHDFRKDGLTADQVGRWYNQLQETMINRRSTTWRNLDENQRSYEGSEQAIQLLLANPTLIQRPVLEHNNQLLLNFSDASYADFFTKD